MAFLEASKEILNIYNHLGERLHELRDVVAGELRLASIYSIGLHELPPALKAYRQQHGNVEVHVEYRRSVQVYAAVMAGEVDWSAISTLFSAISGVMSVWTASIVAREAWQ